MEEDRVVVVAAETLAVETPEERAGFVDVEVDEHSLGGGWRGCGDGEVGHCEREVVVGASVGIWNVPGRGCGCQGCVGFVVIDGC